ncbi:MAG TPA: hypothetical protein VIM75_14460 [Ohtaekwangia sp.]|uniref:hypothetical protein n=1 Tax=Ohtaekwangia sp. TaxID=2066019 RepID=UPI002F94AFD6
MSGRLIYKAYVKKVVLTLLLIWSSGSVACAQSNKELLDDLKSSIEWIDFSKLTFVSSTLIEACTDEKIASKMKLRVASIRTLPARYTNNDRREYQLVLKLLYDAIKNVNVAEVDLQRSKQFLLGILAPYKSINFSVSTDFIIGQLDESRRGMINGYDEGTTTESRFIFFVYDPVLLVKSLIGSKNNDSWNRMGIFLCNYLRDNSNALSLRRVLYYRVQEKMKLLKNIEGFESVNQSLNECDISANLYD